MNIESGLNTPPRILRLQPVRARTGLARNTLFLCIAQGRFPKAHFPGRVALGFAYAGVTGSAD